MEILAKQISPEVQSVKGWIVYVMDVTGRPIQAEVCDLDNLVPTILKFESILRRCAGDRRTKAYTVPPRRHLGVRDVLGTIFVHKGHFRDNFTKF